MIALFLTVSLAVVNWIFRSGYRLKPDACLAAFRRRASPTTGVR